RERAAAIVIADADGAAGDGEAANDGAVGVIENEGAIVHDDTAGEIVPTGSRKRQGGGSVFGEGGGAGDFAGTAEYVNGGGIIGKNLTGRDGVGDDDVGRAGEGIVKDDG